ncbi:unnamed protein product [Owenia fusiformis]|uniref:Uncharacterized protein n=1 Tax=Owenia fusiformis TaxID=6347 RepID=A0A8J1UI15_OWEFU|nr:unnamed protein product [Owenia fusiformis]
MFKKVKAFKIKGNSSAADIGDDTVGGVFLKTYQPIDINNIGSAGSSTTSDSDTQEQPEEKPRKNSKGSSIFNTLKKLGRKKKHKDIPFEDASNAKNKKEIENNNAKLKEQSSVLKEALDKETKTSNENINNKDKVNGVEQITSDKDRPTDNVNIENAKVNNKENDNKGEVVLTDNGDDQSKHALTVNTDQKSEIIIDDDDDPDYATVGSPNGGGLTFKPHLPKSQESTSKSTNSGYASVGAPSANIDVGNNVFEDDEDDTYATVGSPTMANVIQKQQIVPESPDDPDYDSIRKSYMIEATQPLSAINKSNDDDSVTENARYLAQGARPKVFPTGQNDNFKNPDVEVINTNKPQDEINRNEDIKDTPATKENLDDMYITKEQVKEMKQKNQQNKKDPKLDIQLDIPSYQPGKSVEYEMTKTEQDDKEIPKNDIPSPDPAVKTSNLMLRNIDVPFELEGIYESIKPALPNKGFKTEHNIKVITTNTNDPPKPDQIDGAQQQSTQEVNIDSEENSDPKSAQDKQLEPTTETTSLLCVSEDQHKPHPTPLTVEIPSNDEIDEEPIHMSLEEVRGESLPGADTTELIHVTIEELRKSKEYKKLQDSLRPNDGRGEPDGVSTTTSVPINQRRLPPTPTVSPKTSTSEGLNRVSKENVIEDLRKLKDMGWYWGPLSWDDAEIILDKKPDGSFLVRDSSDECHILSLSFRNQGSTHHSRIDYHNGTYGFFSQPASHGYHSIIDFIDSIITNSDCGRFRYFIRQSAPGVAPIPISALHPVSRFKYMRSLQHICRFLLLKHVRYDHIDSLPLPNRVKAYLREPQYYAEYLRNEDQETDDDE